MSGKLGSLPIVALRSFPTAAVLTSAVMPAAQSSTSLLLHSVAFNAQIGLSGALCAERDHF